MEKWPKTRRRAARGSPISKEISVRVGPLASLPTVLEELGFDPERVFKGTGMTPLQFADPDTTVPYVGTSRLLAHCVAVTGCEQLGLLMGERAGPSSLGIAGFLLASAPDVTTALHELVGNLDLHDQGGIPTLHTSGSVTLLGYSILETRARATDQIYDLSVAICCNIMRSLCGADWNPSEVLLSRRSPKDLAPYRRFFRSPLRFDADRSAIVFPTLWLGYRLKAADPLLHRYLDNEARRLRKQQPSPLGAKLFTALRSLLLAHACSLDETGRLLGMHPRTLDRRLRAEGTTYRREIENAKYGIARHLLEETSTPLVEIAETLDYADASAFMRAFRRWSGTTPALWRAKRTAKSRVTKQSTRRTSG